jgi:hypothetical protein
MYLDKFVTVQALKKYETCGECLAQCTDRFSPWKNASNTLCLEALHCRILIQIHRKHSLLPSSSFKEDSCLVAHDVVSLADCFVTFRWNIKSDRKS